MAKIILILVSWVLPLTLMAQSLSGTVTDKSTKESLISATVQLISSEGKSSYTSTDLNGFFQFKKASAWNLYAPDNICRLQSL